MTLVAVGQICSGAKYAHNLAQCRSLVAKAVAAGAKALFLPEASDYIASSAAESISLAKSLDSSEFVSGLRAEAQTNNIAVCVGVHEPAPHDKVKNTLLWIDASGSITQRYQKLHLFDVDVQGGPVIRESDSTEKGDSILPPFPTGFANVGLAICFDLRFPEMSLRLKSQGANLITYPSAFSVPTGEAHWHTLIRASAILTQSYIVAAAQVGSHNEKRASFGHSMVVDPWGKVLVDLPGKDLGEPQLGVADVDIGLVERVRRNMPLHEMRRTDVYPDI